ncbi:hypothetical protein BDP27DRAFT_1394694 [Rhodocollybia butyracea]|uniref:Ribosomal RNA-processing protein 42 n=1 Tax=Rhodocollybia butyracea TaxID=206335 RepID=A0A9P5TYB7_9AGAR|nr:hypothetical protein BDP27DRAFT_1394694 [Rhodocollybia butyracea]
MASTFISKAEKSYIQAGLLANPPRRADGRSLHDFRTISLETGVAPLSNGSARLSLVMAAVKLEVENVDNENAVDGRIACSVSCSPSAYSHLSSGALDDLQHDLTAVLHQTLSHPSLHPKKSRYNTSKKSMPTLGISTTRYSWLPKAALWDIRRFREREAWNIKAQRLFSSASGDMDVDQDTTSGFDTRKGEVLDGRERWPVAITLNLVPTIHFLDATIQEEASCSSRLLFEAEKYTKDMVASLTGKLVDEDLRRNQKARDRFLSRK